MHIEDYPASSPGLIGLWDDIIEGYFAPRHVDIITDFDNEKSLCYTYLVSLNKSNEALSDNTIHETIQTEHVYFLEIEISREKPLASVHYWKYLWKNGEIKLEVSQRPFIENHKVVGDLFHAFAKKYQLLILEDDALEKKHIIEGKTTNFYQQYFHEPD